MCMWFWGQDVAEVNHERMRKATIVSLVYEWTMCAARHTYRQLWTLAHTHMPMSFNTYSPNAHLGAGPFVVVTGCVCISFATSWSAPANACNTRQRSVKAYTHRLQDSAFARNHVSVSYICICGGICCYAVGSVQMILQFSCRINKPMGLLLQQLSEIANKATYVCVCIVYWLINQFNFP